MICKKCKKEIPDDAILCCYCGIRQTEKSRKTKSRGNGTGTVYKLPNGNYMAEVTLGYYIDDNGKMHRSNKKKTFGKKTDAVNALTELKKLVKKNKEDQTLTQLYQRYTHSRAYDKLSKSQQDKMGYAWNKIGKYQFLKITDIEFETLQALVDSGKTYYPSRDIKTLFSHLYEEAIKDQKKVKVNLSAYVDLPEQPKAKRDAWNDEEVSTFWKSYEAGNSFVGYILIMIYIGMRFGELYGMEKISVKLEERYMIGGEKTEAGRDREFVISDKIYDIVKRFYDIGKNKLLEMNVDNFYSKYWEVVDGLELRHLPPQTCRHTFFTMMVQKNVHPAIIASMGGHANYEVAIDHYNRLPLQEKIDAANKL